MRNGSWIGSTDVFDHGTLNLFDGRVYDDLNVYGFGTVNVFDNGVVEEKLKVHGSSTVNVFGGTMEGLFALSSEGTNTSTVNVSGGNIGSGIFTGNSKVTISGGETIGFTARDNSTIEIRGGLFMSSSFSSLVGDSAVVNIFGRDLEFNDGVLTGFLLDGTPISHEFQITDSAQVNLINVPEPASVTLMLLAVSICVLLKRRSWTGRRRSPTGAF
ncbi:MAG: PEP-CTERM sorting domain-containing protein [Planctomycetes bacterium]|nr:PEP-CTERM sorting domain-containing protein [Planctomycetota bacterium]